MKKADDCRYWSTSLFTFLFSILLIFERTNDLNIISKLVIFNFYIFILLDKTDYRTFFLHYIFGKKIMYILLCFLFIHFLLNILITSKKIGWFTNSISGFQVATPNGPSMETSGLRWFRSTPSVYHSHPVHCGHGLLLQSGSP